MTLSEFKAWFEGFSEGIDKAPTEKQFAKIKAKVALIDGTPVTYPVYIERYRHYLNYPVWYSGNTAYLTANAGTLQSASSGASLQLQSAADYDSHAAMHELGRAEALN